MAKSRLAPDAPEKHAQRPPAIILIGGAIVVIALVAFSFTRTLRTPQSASTPAAAVAQSAPAAQPASEAPAQQTAAPATAAALPLPASPRETAAVPIAPTIPGPADAPPRAAQLASVPRIEPVDLMQRLEGKQVTLIDVRDADSYRARHIPGALHIPLAFIAGEVPYLPKDKPIVTYCT